MQRRPKASTVDTIVRSAMGLAARQSYHTTYALLSRTCDTLRLLTDSMDFSDENGDGWGILYSICENHITLGGESEAQMTLIFWMLKLLSFELKTNVFRRQYASILRIILFPNVKLEEAADLLLNLGGREIIDAPIINAGGYTVLHKCLAYASDPINAIQGRLTPTLSRGPDLHRLGFDCDYTPQEETSTSLAMYSSWAFTDWLDGLIMTGVDLEDFIEQELERNHMVHPGWNKQTLLGLFAYDHERNSYIRDVDDCSDCTKAIPGVKVQPYWRHSLERIKQVLDPDNSARCDQEGRGNEKVDGCSIAEAESSSSDLVYHPNATGDTPIVDLSELPSESDSESELKPEYEDDVHGYPATVSLRSDCVYAEDEVICMEGWLHYRQTGTRNPLHGRKRRFPPDSDDDSSFYETSTPGDESSDDGYSPYHIHT